MKSLRKPLLLLVVIVALTAAGLIESFNLLAATHRDQVIQELQKVLGHDVSFESLEVNLWGRPGFVATEFRIADDSRFAATPVVRARRLVLGVSLWNLLLRRLVITSLTFNDPEFQVITDETGRVNLNELIHRKEELRKFPRLRPAAPDRKSLAVSFSIDEVAIKQGRIDYIDRSVRQPAELRVRNVSMKIRGFQAAEATRIQIGASLTEGLGQDLRISGEIARLLDNRSWLQRDIDLNVQVDSLHVPVVARAIAALREKIPRELDVTGPMALRMKARGTLERPRLEEITLRIPLFGSTEYNAVVTGAIKFTERRSWEEAALDGKLTIDPLSLSRVRAFAIFEKLLPADLTSEGSVKVSSRFEGTWENLRIGVLVLGNKADIRYKDWLRKPAEAPATIRARISKQPQGLVFHPSELDLGTQQLNFSGGVENQPAPRLHARFYGRDASASAWSRFLSVPGLQTTAGKLDLDVTASKGLSSAESNWDLRGVVKLDKATLKHSASGRTFDNLQAQISLDGTKAKIQTGSLRLGKSIIFLNGSAADLIKPRLDAVFRSPDLHLADLPGFSGSSPVRLKNATGQAETVFGNDRWLLIGSLTATEGSVSNWPLRELRADIELEPEGLTFKNLQAQTLRGELRADGFLPGVAGQARPLSVSSQIDAIDMRALLVQLFPPLRDRFEGQLSGQGQIESAGGDAIGAKGALTGSGEAHIRNGMIRDFNLASQLLLKGSDSAGAAQSVSRMPPGFAALLTHRNTTLEWIEATFRIEQNRLFSENLVITTPDYTITGAGWVAFDRSARWNGMLVLSPRLTQEIQREYRSIRYLLDRRGRLAIGFRVDGKIPDLSIRLENRALAQTLGIGTGQKDADGQDGETGGKEGKNWIPDALERYLKR
jgi:hypothetical protein